ncbi:T9SS-dependent choice-of-anchor J family protein [Flavobacterium sp. N1994]|uniref:T9SS-dependent choice-of-anchor J family protein n=1 Tax=Flavobacterium sp. N1994 TaxID=2986827 RepID=UPI0022236BE4|nr:choice-of-anchor J domain-containing protein [Flavobacterium sp. N1994]
MMKKITLLLLFLIGSVTSSFGQFSEGFESGIPATWTVINGGDTNTWAANTFTPHGGTGDVSIGYSATAHDDHLVTPAITVTAGSTDRISFWARSRDPLYPEVFDVKLSTTTAAAADFTVTLEAGVAPASGTNFYQYFYDLSTYVGQTVYISIYSSTTDQFRLDIDDFVNDAIPSVAPSCAANPVSTPNATCGNFASTISWDAVAGATGYNLTVGTTSGGTDVVNNVNIGNVLTYNFPTQTPGTTYYWKVVPFNAVGPATGCTENSYTTFASGCYCDSLPTSNDGLGITNVTIGATNFPNGDVTYFDNSATSVNLAQGLTSNVAITFSTGYTYDTNIWIDFNNDFDFDDAGELVQTGIASTNADPTTLDASFNMPVTAPLGQHRMRIGAADSGQVPPDPCYSDTYGVTLDFTVNIIVAPTDLPDYANLQYPYTQTIAAGGSFTVYGRVYEGGLTDTTTGQAPGINAWVGYSTTDANPNTFTNWVPATFNVETDGGNNDEYQAIIGATLAPGTYYYATRFQLNGGAYVYGGTNYGFWNGTDKVNGVLTVTPPPPVTPNCDLASALPDPSLGGSTWTRPLAGGTGLSGVGIGVSYHIYGPFTVDTTGSYTFTSTQDFDGMIFVYQNSFDPNNQLTNFVAGNDDSGPGSVITTDLTTGITYYFVTTSFSPTDFGNFSTDITGAGTVTCGTLGVPGFDNSNFAYYPNPVKNVLNLSYNQEISNVEVFNILGQKISTNKINASTAQIDMSNLSKGAYMVKITSNDQIKTIKVIKE